MTQLALSESPQPDERPTTPNPKRTPKKPKEKVFRKSFMTFERPKREKLSLMEDIPLITTIKNVFGNGIDEDEEIRKRCEVIFKTPSVPLYPSLIPEIVRPNKRFLVKQEMFCVLIESFEDNNRKKYDCWSSLVLPKEEWTEHAESFNVDLNSVKANGMHVESSIHSFTHNTDLGLYQFVDIETNFSFFKSYFNGKTRSIFYGFEESGTILCYQKGLILQLVLVFEPKGIHRFTLPCDQNCVSWWKDSMGITETPIKIKAKSKFLEELVKFEDLNIVCEHRVGVLYAKGGQTHELEMYKNTECSEAFWKFMNLISKEEEVKGWERYSGGLDVVHADTNSHFYYTNFCGFEIAFHVAPLLPSTTNDEQLERKRFVGNDVVVIIFKEKEDDTDVVDPIFVSKMNCLFIVVTPHVKTQDNTKYKINVVCHNEIIPFPPYVEDVWYEHGEGFKIFFLHKVVNACRTVIKCGALLGRTTRSNERLLRSIIVNGIK
ncbi:rap GTPase-activating protein, putative [Entamoeba invadens IP1]|uniref:Rap GTPase-activating protein, putative n=1 Tax=Entamoeba invadens IP1 TaxID=370355 RepID=A0A0A1UBU7_ENTIV|nr:rap GTPase-activating protein, putative [Entamoeba invadens IP1]ELP92681.1 rap GTPase-activating protein, putative [Entamoeba invadens IP1]|eukprot:XP_004259452.1 rap GTPase-activating protein, putative [Entamoeba invadens IP1]